MFHCVPTLNLLVLQLFLLNVFVAETKKNSNRFEFFFCFSNKILMLQMRIIKKPSCPHTLRRFFETFFYFNQSNSFTRLKTNQNKTFALITHETRLRNDFKFCFMFWNPCDTETNFHAIATKKICCNRMKICFRVPEDL